MKLLIGEMREKKKVSIRELSKRTGIARSALSRYENNQRFPRADKLETIAAALGAHIEELYDSEYK